ncbi:MAG: sugar phosphate nucleotidyltransferase [Flavobacteriaceae bacterium]|nr:sugar phosphate nucleotidyltransferase [Flavobacteriaceae bacterium]
MKIIIPMAGRGSRLRPHTLTVPKPLIPIAGKPIVHRLAEDITRLSQEKIDEIVFITGDFGKDVEEKLVEIATKLGAKGTIYRQDKPLGTAHAIYQAKDSITGPVIIAFADTLFKADFELNTESDGVIWVKSVEDPSSFGVVELDNEGVINKFHEKPQEFISDLAIIGIYYIKDGDKLRTEIEDLLSDEANMRKGEYQLTDVLENLKSQGIKFTTGKVDEWMDCGNKTVTVETNTKVLGFEKELLKEIPASSSVTTSLIIEPCFIGENVIIENSKIGPNVSIGNGTVIRNSNIDNSLIQENTSIDHGNLTNSMIGNKAEYYGVSRNISLGDFSILDFNSK